MHIPVPDLPAALLLPPRLRYIVSTDGWAASSKLERYLLLGSVVLKQQSPHESWFYDAMKPWVHYVPFMVDNATDIVQVIHISNHRVLMHRRH